MRCPSCVLVGWRFQRNAMGVGRRFESTAYLGVDYPLQTRSGGLATVPGNVAAAVTGYASRSLYAWLGALARRPMDGPSTERPGTLLMYSGVLGYRPRRFRQDYPRPDLRVFLEVVGERVTPDRVAGSHEPDTGSCPAVGKASPWRRPVA